MLRRVLALPPRAVARKAAQRIGGAWTRAKARARDRRDGTFGAGIEGDLVPLVGVPPPLSLLEANRGWIDGMAALHLEGYVDMLGSGWTRVRHGMACRGVEGHRYDSGPAVEADAGGAWLEGRTDPANLPEAQRLWRLIEPPYVPVDWHLDFKSGHRWAEDVWHADIRFGHLPGVDVKVPWELARMHHLTTLGLCYGLDGGQGARAEACRRLFRNQLLDFAATNPPRFGVNWRCPMDAAIRAANQIVAWSLFRAFGASFDPAFEAALRDSLYRHGAHVFAHLEWDPEHRANHYLADICGLAFIAAALPRTADTDGWLAFAVKALVEESAFQFLPDGANFEASTCYHRLSAEMLVYTTALALGLSDGKRAAVRNFIPAEMGRRIAGAAAFVSGLRKPDGRMPQIGDNDSGRFLKIAPAVRRTTVAESLALYRSLDGYGTLPGDAVIWDEDSLDHRHLTAAAAGLTGPSVPDSLDSWLVGEFAGGARLFGRMTVAESAGGDLPPVPDRAARPIIGVPGAHQGLETLCWPDFGLYLFRSRRLYLLVRCGPVGQNGRGGHAHNDQLAIELNVDGEDWIADPGSYLYTADRHWRDAYRSVAAHAAPRGAGREPSRLDLGDFWLQDNANARCLSFGPTGFAGAHDAYGETVTRWVRVVEDAVEIVDAPAGDELWWHAEREAVRARLGPAVPFSPGYGLRFRED